MLTARTLYNRIDRIIELAYLTFMFDLIGDDLMSDDQKRQLEQLGLIIGRKPLIDILYTLIRLKPEEGYGDRRIQDLIDNIASTGRLPVFTDTQQATLENAKAAFLDSVESTKAEVKKKIRQEISNANQKYKQEATVRRYQTVDQARERKDKHVEKLLAAVAVIGPLIQRSFVRSFTTDLTNFVNDSVVDRTTDDHLFTGVDPTKIKVYKKVINDGSLCDWCARFYGVREPKIYTLAELQANGSNFSKPKSAWKPIIGATHPRCRCELHIAR